MQGSVNRSCARRNGKGNQPFHFTLSHFTLSHTQPALFLGRCFQFTVSNWRRATQVLTSGGSCPNIVSLR